MKSFPDSARGSSTGRPIMVLFDILGKKWTMRILWELRDIKLNFRDLQQRCDQISPTVLNGRLKQLRSLQLVELNSQGYGLSKAGAELCEHLITLDVWAKTWRDDN